MTEMPAYTALDFRVAVNLRSRIAPVMRFAASPTMALRKEARALELTVKLAGRS
jgi:hypothetical protein